jgi:hypothetical protein
MKMTMMTMTTRIMSSKIRPSSIVQKGDFADFKKNSEGERIKSYQKDWIKRPVEKLLGMQLI